jgi:hypothetical protein
VVIAVASWPQVKTKMNDKRSLLGQVGLWAAFAAVIGALFGIRSNPAPVAEKPAAEKPAAESIAARPTGPEPHRKVVLDFVDPPSMAESQDAETHREFRAYLAGRCRALIVTLPDPVDTPFGFWFDQIVDSLTLAADEVGYRYAKHWFPWERFRQTVGLKSGSLPQAGGE